MWPPPCSCATEMKRMPASGNRSSASMYAEPTMPKTSLTPWATSVSTNASDGVIFCLPVTATGSSTGLFIGLLLAHSGETGRQVFHSALLHASDAACPTARPPPAALQHCQAHRERLHSPGAGPRIAEDAHDGRRDRRPAPGAGPALDNSGRIHETTLAFDSRRPRWSPRFCWRQHVCADRRSNRSGCASRPRCRRRRSTSSC